MAARYYIVQFAQRNAGWTDLPLLSSVREHFTINLMKQVSERRPHYAMRVWRKPVGWEPDAVSEGIDVIEASISAMDRASRQEVVAQGGYVAPEKVAAVYHEPESAVQVDAAALTIVSKLKGSDNTRFAITAEAIDEAVTKHVAHNRKMHDAITRLMLPHQQHILQMLKVDRPADEIQQLDAERVISLRQQVRDLLLNASGYEDVDGILYPTNI